VLVVVNAGHCWAHLKRSMTLSLATQRNMQTGSVAGHADY